MNWVFFLVGFVIERDNKEFLSRLSWGITAVLIAKCFVGEIKCCL